jgi:hypothetical protein
MLACKHVRAHMSDALDGEVRGLYGAYVWFHSRVCIPCRRVRRSLKRTVSLLHELRDESAPGDDPSRPPS